MSVLYCYNSTCPRRTKEEPWPSSTWHFKWVKVISKKGNEYKRKMAVCVYCSEPMTATFSVHDDYCNW